MPMILSWFKLAQLLYSQWTAPSDDLVHYIFEVFLSLVSPAPPSTLDIKTEICESSFLSTIYALHCLHFIHLGP